MPRRKDLNSLYFMQSSVFRDQSQSENRSGCRNESIRRILVWQPYCSAEQCHFSVDRGLLHRRLGQGCTDPSFGVGLENDAPFLTKDHSLPNTDRRDPQLVLGVLKLFKDFLTEPFGFEKAPKPDMSVQQQLQSLRTSHSSSSVAGDITSPTMVPVPRMHPSQGANAMKIVTAP